MGQPGGTAAELALDLELTVRDYLNEGGKVLFTGKNAGLASGANGVYFYNPFERGARRVHVRGVPVPTAAERLPAVLARRLQLRGRRRHRHRRQPFPVNGVSGAFNGFAGTLNGGDSANNQDHTAAFLLHVELPAGRAVPAVRQLGALQVAAAGRCAVRAAHR